MNSSGKVLSAHDLDLYLWPWSLPRKAHFSSKCNLGYNFWTMKYRNSTWYVNFSGEVLSAHDLDLVTFPWPCDHDHYGEKHTPGASDCTPRSIDFLFIKVKP